jgi:hypothetical protein
MDEINLLPAQRAHLRRSQTVAESQQDHGGVPMLLMPE